jgi:hypothetical protein
MRDLVFYNAACVQVTGARRLILPLRRSVRRLLLPLFQRLVEILQTFDLDLEQVGVRQAQLEATQKEREAEIRRLQQQLAAVSRRQYDLEAFQLDHEALVRRLAALEDHVEALLHERMLGEPR